MTSAERMAEVRKPDSPEFAIAYPGDWSIADRAQFRVWNDIRRTTRRELLASVLFAAFYLASSFLVGAFMFHAMDQMADQLFEMSGWQVATIEMTGLDAVVVVYLVLAGLVSVFAGYVLFAWLHWLPAVARSGLLYLPWIGPPLRAVTLGHWSEAVLAKLEQESSYADAIESSAKTISHGGMKRWCNESAASLRGGAAIEQVLQTIPVSDHPVAALTSLVGRTGTHEQTVAIWRHACDECHHLGWTRSQLTRQSLSTVTLILSATIAMSAVLLSMSLLGRSLTPFSGY